MSDERIIGTKGETATVFDTRTGRELMTLAPSISNQYAKNRATFNPTDELVLSGEIILYWIIILYVSAYTSHILSYRGHIHSPL